MLHLDQHLYCMLQALTINLRSLHDANLSKWIPTFHVLLQANTTSWTLWKLSLTEKVKLGQEDDFSTQSRSQTFIIFPNLTLNKSHHQDWRLPCTFASTDCRSKTPYKQWLPASIIKQLSIIWPPLHGETHCHAVTKIECLYVSIYLPVLSCLSVHGCTLRRCLCLLSQWVHLGGAAYVQ